MICTSIKPNSELDSENITDQLAVLLGPRLRYNPDYDQIERQCTRCHEWWPADKEFFYAQATGLFGLESSCKACKEDYRRTWAAKNKRKGGKDYTLINSEEVQKQTKISR